MAKYSFLSNADPEAINQLYEQYKRDPESVEFGWRKFFEGFEFSFPGAEREEDCPNAAEFKVINLIEDYRKRGHLFTRTNPVRTRREYSPGLDLENYGLKKNDLNKKFDAGHKLGIGRASLKDIIAFLDQTYCQSIGVEYVFIRNTEIVKWLKERMESDRNTPSFSPEDKRKILFNLSRAVSFEKFIHKKFPGQKRFSLEGAESLIPALDAIIEKGSEQGVEEFIIGMPHRGRLNVLYNTLNKPARDIFGEFAGKTYDDETLLGDVKYHLGATSTKKLYSGKEVKLSLSPNPSHLEAVNPVVEGICRAKLDQHYKGDLKKILPILIHGDASIAGQGVVYEVVQMAGLEGYTNGGSIHLVVNNQIGFTTNYLEGRSSTYCTDVAKITQSPVFHVNADDVEAVAYTIILAMEFRQKFHKDVFIDLLGYRKYGHNEGDEPRFTQPILYKTIEKHPDPLNIYTDKLLKDNELSAAEANNILSGLNESLERSLKEAESIEHSSITSFLQETWKGIRKASASDFDSSPATAVNKDVLLNIARKIHHLPEEKKFFRKIVRLHNDRLKSLEQQGKADWAMAELLAYGSLLNEGIPVRLSGQDSQRGTFSHRHAVLTIEDSEEKYIPLNHIDDKQAHFDVLNSPLSEYGVLGFEYGYSLASPHSLTIWEAQFGDFNNGAQIIFDQYISSGEDKWNIMNDLVVYLPHAYEGQGPEHSSARMERFLILAAEQNFQIANCSTPANFFHILRRQLHRPFRKPLIIFTPKSLLRHPEVVSDINELSQGGFKELLDDKTAEPEHIKKLIFCTGKVFYDLLAEKRSIKNKDTALIRLEQLHPLPEKTIKELIKKYKNVERYLWVQEEPVNMGAWSYMHEKFLHMDIDLKVIARPASGSPATGSSDFHKQRQRKIVEKSFEECICPRVKEECKMVCIGNNWKSFEKENKLVYQK